MTPMSFFAGGGNSTHHKIIAVPTGKAPKMDKKNIRQ
jgi:hypothetical protein